MMDDMSYIQDAHEDPELEQLIQATQQLNRQINDAIQDDAINWGNVPTIQDLSESDCVSNCSNLRNCLLGNKTQQYFNAKQLTINEYLALVEHHTIDDKEMEEIDEDGE